jgi:aryl-phospho-beta-D-glucosidase BglC (GH1 family)
MERLRVENGRIVLPSGQPLLLRGYNIGGWLNLEDFINGFIGAEHTLRAAMQRSLGPQKAQFFFDRLLDYFFTEEDVAAMAGMGANLLRIPFNYRHFETDGQPFEYLEAGFARLDQAMDWCARHGLYVILDFHAVQGWHNPDWHSDNAHVHTMLYSHRLFQDRFVGLWEQMAARYKNHPALAGYDLMNEPLTRMDYDYYDASFYDWDALNAVHRRAAAAIRAIDPEHILFIEGDSFACEYDGLDVTFDDNLVISTHNYMAPTGGGSPYPGEIDGIFWNRDIVAAEFGMHSGTRLALKQRKPILVGEFGVWYAGYPQALPYRIAALDDQLGVFDSAGVHWTIWTWKDIASMGSYNLDPESEYLRAIQPVQLARQLAADWEGEMPTGAVAKAFKTTADTIDQELARVGIGQQIDRRWFGQFALFAYLAQFLQVPYASIFKGKSETQLDTILQAFTFKHCIPNQPLIDVIKKHLGSKP